MGNVRGSGRTEPEEEPGRDLFGDHALAILFRWVVFGGRSTGIIHGGAPLASAVGRFQASRAVAEPAIAQWGKENGRKVSSSAAEIGVADVAAVPGIQHARRKLADTGHRPGARIADRAPNIHD